MFVTGLQIINWASILEKTKQNVYYVAQNIDLSKVNSLDINYDEVHIKQYETVTYLGSLLDGTFSGESTTLKVINKINSRLRFLYRKNGFLSPPLRRLHFNSLLEPHFDYACSAWYPNLNKRLKSKLQILQNKCTQFCLNLNNRAHIG